MSGAALLQAIRGGVLPSLVLAALIRTSPAAASDQDLDQAAAIATALRQRQQELAVPMLVGFMGNGASKLRPALEEALAGLPIRFRTAAPGGWERLEMRRIHAQEGLGCSVFLSARVGEEVELSVLGSCLGVPDPPFEVDSTPSASPLPGEPPQPEPAATAGAEEAPSRKTTLRAAYHRWRHGYRYPWLRPLDEHDYSISASFLAPVLLKPNIEARLAPRRSVSLSSLALLWEDFTVLGAGGGYRGYPVGDFDCGMLLATEAYYLHVQTNTVRAGGILLAYTGAKFTSVSGFMVEAQAGLGLARWITPRRRSTGFPYVNVNLGYSL